MQTPFLRRALAATLAVASLAVGGLAAAAPSEDEVDDAYARAKQLVEEVNSARSELEGIDARVQEIAARVEEQTAEVERVTTALEQTRERIGRLERRFDVISQQLGERAAEAFIDGPGSTTAMLLGSESMDELSDRLEFVDTIAQDDADLATRVANARTELGFAAANLADLRQQERAVLARVRADQATLVEELEQQRSLVAEIERKEAAAERYAEQLDDERTEYLDSLATPPLTDGGGGGPLPPGTAGVFRVCPVDAPKVVTDSFGAPRYVGGYHPHKGDDIMAPAGTPIRSPFDGVARDATNSIGGISVIVQGSAGWVYNAHMSRIGSLGSVQAGDIIGYVGMTGASGAGVNHNHFEYHPNVTPTSWPESAYGYSIIDDAVNPYPLLASVC
jgi:murein DD-endopeptidase MepM/ murein hydrolase activator NlpD